MGALGAGVTLGHEVVVIIRDISLQDLTPTNCDFVMNNRLLVDATSSEVVEGVRVFHAKVASHERGAPGEGGAASKFSGGKNVNCKHLFAVHFFSRFSMSIQALRNWLKSRMSFLNRSKAIIS